MIFIILPLICSGVIATVAAYFSIVGLAAIFEATYWPVIVMGISLEAGKLLGAAWIHEHWNYSPKKLLWPLTAMVVVLMLINSLGVFGFLARGHLDQSNPVQQTQLVIDRKELELKRYQSEIDSYVLARTQLDKALDVQLDAGKASSALRSRSAQKEEREQLAIGIKDAEKQIAAIQDELLVLRESSGKVTAKLGPIVYVFDFLKDAGIINKTSTDTGSAVRLVILAIVFAFDPLAVLLIIAAQISYKKWIEDRPLRLKIRDERHQLAMDRIAERKARRDMRDAERRAQQAEETALEKEFEAEERIEVAEEVADVVQSETKVALTRIRARRQKLEQADEPRLERETDIIHMSPTRADPEKVNPIPPVVAWLDPKIQTVPKESVVENNTESTAIPKEPIEEQSIALGTDRLASSGIEDPIVLQKRILVQADDVSVSLEEALPTFQHTIPEEPENSKPNYTEIAPTVEPIAVENAVVEDVEPEPIPPTTVDITPPLRESFEQLSDDVLEALLLVRTGQGTSPELTAKISRLTPRDRVMLKQVLEENPELIPNDTANKQVPWLDPH